MPLQGEELGVLRRFYRVKRDSQYNANPKIKTCKSTRRQTVGELQELALPPLLFPGGGLENLGRTRIKPPSPPTILCRLSLSPDDGVAACLMDMQDGVDGPESTTAQIL